MSTLEDYEQGGLIGGGGFADVYRAVHVPSRNPVALKIGRQDDESQARIRREIEVLELPRFRGRVDYAAKQRFAS